MVCSGYPAKARLVRQRRFPAKYSINMAHCCKQRRRRKCVGLVAFDVMPQIDVIAAQRELYCPACSNPVLPGAKACGSCLTNLTIPGGRRATESTEPPIVSGSPDPFLRAFLVALAVGCAVTLLFFVGFFLIAGMLGGAMGTAPAVVDIYAAMIELARRILGLPEQGSLGPASIFWGIVSALLTFAVLLTRAGVARASLGGES